MKVEVKKFGRHKPPSVGHVTIKYRHGWPSRWQQKRIIVTLTDGKWLSESGDDYTDQIEHIERMKLIKKLEAICGK